MKKRITSFIFMLAVAASQLAVAQENETIFKHGGIRRSGGYAAISNKFTTINGDFANMPEIYGGWFINQKWLLGVEAAATTNFIRVPAAFSDRPGARMTYQYGQFGIINEYVIASTRKVHVVANLITGAGFNMQYERHNWGEWDDRDDWHDDRDFDERAYCFGVIEPGVQVEFNLLKWMRFSPGVSYRRTIGATGNGLRDGKLSNMSYNVTLKFGVF